MAGEQIREGLDSAVETEESVDEVQEEQEEQIDDSVQEEQLEEPEVKTEEVQETEQEVSPELTKLQTDMATIKSQLENAQKIAEFYQAQYNNLIGKKEPKEEVKDKGKVSAEDLLNPPDEWGSTKEVVDFFDNRNNSIVEKAFNQRYQEAILPMFQRADQAISALINYAIKPNKPDWDDIIKEVNNELFITDPTGQHIISEKNPGLLQYFRNQPLPILAMYEYGKNKKASVENPKIIKNAIQKGTTDTLKKITQKKKGAINIRSGQEEALPELTFDTPRADAEKILGKRGIIPK